VAGMKRVTVGQGSPIEEDDVHLVGRQHRGGFSLDSRQGTRVSCIAW
jgi:hypothetical protein